VVILASARLDQQWSSQPNGISPNLPVQSHIANVRTNPGWYHESDNNIVQGRADWFSLPVTVEIEMGPTNTPSVGPSMVPTKVPEKIPVTLMPVIDVEEAKRPIKGNADSPATTTTGTTASTSETLEPAAQSQSGSVGVTMLSNFATMLCLCAFLL